jgi:hypothetical protein
MAIRVFAGCACARTAGAPITLAAAPSAAALPARNFRRLSTGSREAASGSQQAQLVKIIAFLPAGL